MGRMAVWSGSLQACVTDRVPVERRRPLSDRAVCQLPACMHLTQIGRQGTENTCGLTAEPCSARGKTLPHILVLPARPAPWSGNVYPPLWSEAVQSCIVIVSLWHRYPT
ncbi:MAG: hypothetical protein IJL48_11535 [Bacteroidales bacterium]|nr:hypothetical protein [Bacteroidales bacterium]